MLEEGKGSAVSQRSRDMRCLILSRGSALGGGEHGRTNRTDPWRMPFALGAPWAGHSASGEFMGATGRVDIVALPCRSSIMPKSIIFGFLSSSLPTYYYRKEERTARGTSPGPITTTFSANAPMVAQEMGRRNAGLKRARNHPRARWARMRALRR